LLKRTTLSAAIDTTPILGLGHANAYVTAKHYARQVESATYREPMALLPGEVPADLLARIAFKRLQGGSQRRRRFKKLNSSRYLRGRPPGNRTPNPRVKRTIETQEITPTYVSCLARGGRGRHWTAPSTAPRPYTAPRPGGGGGPPGKGDLACPPPLFRVPSISRVENRKSARLPENQKPAYGFVEFTASPRSTQWPGLAG
jgi:hypothetical protein